MARKWFQLVGEDGAALTSATSVSVEIEDVDAFRDAVFAKASRALPATVIAADLRVFANQAAYDAKQALEEDSPIWSFGGLKVNALIVQVPQRASETSATAQMVKEIHDQVVQDKWKRYSHSKVGSTAGRELLQDLNIHVEPVRTVCFAAGGYTPTEPFTWGSVCDAGGQRIALSEVQQRERYLAYVEANIGHALSEKGLCVVGVETGHDILTVRIKDRQIELKGRTDLLIMSDLVKANPDDVQFMPGVKMLIEVKRQVKPSDVFQALSELIALDLIAKDPVMALLTDLSNNWQFFWVSEKIDANVSIYKATIKDPGQAFETIRSLIAQPPVADAEIIVPSVEAPVKRRKLAHLLQFVSEEGESSGVREAIERYYDIASMLGPDIDMARAAASQITQAIPMFSYYT